MTDCDKYFAKLRFMFPRALNNFSNHFYLLIFFFFFFFFTNKLVLGQRTSNVFPNVEGKAKAP